MHMNSTGFLEQMVENGAYILFEKGAPYSRRKADVITVKAADGRDLVLATLQGLRASPVEMPRVIFDDFLAAHFIEQDGEEDDDARLIFRLTPDAYQQVGR